MHSEKTNTSLSTYRDIINPLEVNSEMNFATFYNTYHQRFVRYAYYYVNDEPTAEDMTHDALLYYWENRHKLAADMDVLGYILQSVKNKCLNYLKHVQVEWEYSKNYANLYDWEIDMRIQTLESESYATIFTKDILKIVEDSLAELPEQTREIFLLNRLKNKSRKDIAQLLGVSQQKIDYHINKANDHLKHRLKDYVPFLLLFFN